MILPPSYGKLDENNENVLNLKDESRSCMVTVKRQIRQSAMDKKNGPTFVTMFDAFLSNRFSFFNLQESR